uniref:Phage head-tail adaptor n=1 Tax=biofilter metagenome TaxID=1070537 RepID=A0A193SBN8_9ZZZZ
MGSTERLAAAQMESGQTHVVTVHFRPALAAAKGSWRILLGERRFGVVGLPRNIDEGNRKLVFDCTEFVNG